MNKLQKSILVFGLLVLSIAVAYYLVFYLPKFNTEKFLLSQQEKCLEIGQETYKADLQQYGVKSLEDPRYGYSKKLNTCIYSSGYHYYGNQSSGIGGDIFKHNCDAYWERWVKNSYSNEKIIEVSNYLDNKCQWMTKTEFINKFDTDSEALFNS